MVEQHARIALDFTENAVILDRGAIVYNGPSAALREDPERLAELIGVGHVGAGH
jgi:branched-chain amino acid transport system ATP-binding protein